MTAENDLREWAKGKIQSVGLRATPARISTLVVLRNSRSPLSHRQVSASLEVQGFDRATVFRNLNDMVTAGLLRRSQLGDHAWRFELIPEDEPHHAAHPHFVCIDCGSISCLEEIELTKKSRLASQRFGKVTEILLRGHCGECA